MSRNFNKKSSESHGKQIKKAISKPFSSFFRLRLFVLIFAILLLCSLWSSLMGIENTKTFAGFLEFLTTVPTIPLDFLQIKDITFGYWGIFSPFQSFIFSIIDVFNVLLFFCTCILNALSFILWFLRWVLVM